MRGKGTKPTGTSYDFIKHEAVHPTVFLENYSSWGMLTILIKIKAVSILINIFAGKSKHIISKNIPFGKDGIRKMRFYQVKFELKKREWLPAVKIVKHSVCNMLLVCLR